MAAEPKTEDKKTDTATGPANEPGKPQTETGAANVRTQSPDLAGISADASGLAPVKGTKTAEPPSNNGAKETVVAAAKEAAQVETPVLGGPPEPSAFAKNYAGEESIAAADKTVDYLITDELDYFDVAAKLGYHDAEYITAVNKDKDGGIATFRKGDKIKVPQIHQSRLNRVAL